ncbi:MAG: DedA family protein [Methylocystaceae bacterium]
MLESLLTAVAIKVTGLITRLGYWGIALAMAVESCNVPIPSEIIHPFAGYLVSTGQFKFLPAVLAGTMGGLAGSIISYYMGFYLMESPLLFFVSVQRRESLKQIFNQYGEGIVFFGRLLPMVRTVISLPAGAARMNIGKFIVYTLAGSLIWAFVLTYIGYLLGKNWKIISVYFHEADLLILVILGLGLVYWLWRRKRRLV